MSSEIYDRNMRFFGKEGQDRLADASVAIVGVGGLGTHVVQQLALLGVGRLILIDHEELDKTNFNRYVGVRHDDPVPGTLKVTVGERTARDVNPGTEVATIPEQLATRSAFAAIGGSDYIFGCLDNEGSRLILTELCHAYSKPYFDLASDIIVEEGVYGGRICVSWNGEGCLICYDELDAVEASKELMNPDARRDHEAIYGVPKDALSEAGPSVVSINGVIASLGVTEFMLAVTKIRDKPRGLLKYYGDRGIVAKAKGTLMPSCYYCNKLRGIEDAAQVDRFITVIC